MSIQEVLEPKALNLKNAARYIGAPESTVGHWCREGRIPFRKIGRSTFILVSDLDKLLGEREGEPR